MRMLIAGLILMALNVANAGITVKQVAEKCPGPYQTKQDMKANDAEICINILSATYDGVMTALIQGSTIQEVYAAENEQEARSMFDLADSSPEALTKLCHKKIPSSGVLFPELFAWSIGNPEVRDGSLASGLIAYLYTKYDLYQCGDTADIRAYEGRINRKKTHAPPVVKTPVKNINHDVVQSRINGTFNGWDGDTIFELENGQIWKQRDYAYMYHYAYRPKVTIIKEDFSYKMFIEDVTETLVVEKIK